MKINVTKFKTIFLGFLVSLIFVFSKYSFAQLQEIYSIHIDCKTNLDYNMFIVSKITSNFFTIMFK